MIRHAITFLAAAAAPTAEAQTMKHATGSFEVKITPEGQAPAPDGGVATARMGIAKTFSGGLVGTAQGTMLAAGTPAPGQAASYVAVDQVTGAIDGRKGGFVLLHRGVMTKAGGGDLDIVIATDSGTGDLAGITGTLAIEIRDGRHFYDLAYSLPDTP